LITTNNFAKETVLQLRKANLYRTLRSVSAIRKMDIRIDGRRAVNFCSNDYLGLSQNPAVLKATRDRLCQISQCSSRLVSGNSPDIDSLEKRLAKHRRTECALAYPTGYMANLGVLTVLADKTSIIYSDEFNHSSIIDGCRLSGATIRIFRHNNVNDLQRLIDTDKKLKLNSRKRIIITEGIFSMNGDIANLSEICQIAKAVNAMTILDDAHGDFILGHSKEYAGTPDLFRVSRDIDVHVSSLSKALGCFGGYIAASYYIRELLINKSRQLIYTSAIPSYLCQAAIASISVAAKGFLQKKLCRNIEYFVEALRKLGFSTSSSSTPIIPIIVRDEKSSVDISNSLLKRGVFVQAIRYPTVKKGRAQLRVSLTAIHDRRDLDFALSCLETTARKYQLI
jgi:glycine C-acetyltransferase